MEQQMEGGQWAEQSDLWEWEHAGQWDQEGVEVCVSGFPGLEWEGQSQRISSIWVFQAQDHKML